MQKKIIINESMLRHIVLRSFIEESVSKDADTLKILKDAIKNDNDIKREFEKKVKDIVASCVNNLFKTLWQRRNFYEDEIRKG